MWEGRGCSQVCELITINGANLCLLRFPCQSHRGGGATLARVVPNLLWLRLLSLPLPLLFLRTKTVELNSQPQIAGERQRKAGRERGVRRHGERKNERTKMAGKGGNKGAHYGAQRQAARGGAGVLCKREQKKGNETKTRIKRCRLAACVCV